MRIYIHIPFCDSKCGYCGFFSKIGEANRVDEYKISLLKDIDFYLKSFHFEKIDSVFIGGGTPNFVHYSFYEEIFNRLQPFFAQNIEISIESNPNLISKEWLLEMKNMGINRLSMGVQSFFEDKLKLLERNHNPKDINKAFEISKNIFNNVNVDLIYDCKLDNKHRLEIELTKALELHTTHISAYSLSIDPKSNFNKNQKIDALSNESYSHFVRDFLLDKSAIWYEVSNFAMYDKCFHNLGYWAGDEYLGFGASSVSRIGNKRYFASSNLDKYIEFPTQRRIEILTPNDLLFETIFMGFRSEIGVEKEILNKEKLDILLKEKICFERDKKVFLKDLFLADEVSTWIF